MLPTRPPRKPNARLRGRSLLAAALLALAFGPASGSPAPAAPAPAAVEHKPAKPTRKAKPKARSKAKAKRPAKPKGRSTRHGDELALRSHAALVVDQKTGELVATKNADLVLPIASLTKLMTALVAIESGAPLDEMLTIGAEDIDTHKKTTSRLKVGTRLTRDQMLLLALMSSENRAAHAVARHHPGGYAAFIARMNERARALGMSSTRFVDPTGLSERNVSTARDLHALVSAAHAQPLVRRYSTQQKALVRVGNRMLTFSTSNRLIRKAGNWDIELQKTGFTNEAGRCLVMQANVVKRSLAMIFLDSQGSMTRYADAARIKKRLEREARLTQRASSS